MIIFNINEIKKKKREFRGWKENIREKKNSNFKLVKIIW